MIKNKHCLVNNGRSFLGISILLSICLYLGCSPIGQLLTGRAPSKGNSNQESNVNQVLSPKDPLEEAAMRLVDLKSRVDWPKVPLGSLADHEQGEVIFEKTLSKEVREGLIGTGTLLSKINQSPDKTPIVRIDIAKVTTDIDPFEIANTLGEPLGATGRFPFKIGTGAQIEFLRLFTNLEEAKRAVPLKLADLPLSVESIKRFPIGTVVTIPVEAHFSLSITGKELARSLSFSKELLPVFKASTAGQLSAASSGMMIGQGALQLQISRLEGAKVRLKFVTGRDFSASGRVSGGFVGTGEYVFLPSSLLQSVRDLRLQMEHLKSQHVTNNPIRIQVRSAEERIEMFKKETVPQIRALLDQVRLVTSSSDAPSPLEEALKKASQGVDLALDEANKWKGSLAELDALIFQRVEESISKLENIYSDRIEKPIDLIAGWSNRLFDLKSMLTLSAEFGRRMRYSGQFIFDLDNEVARRAFERAVFGKSLWLLGVKHPSVKDFASGQVFFDLSTVQSLASNGISEENQLGHHLNQNGIVIEEESLSDHRSSTSGLSFEALSLKAETYRKQDTLVIGWKEKGSETFPTNTDRVDSQLGGQKNILASGRMRVLEFKTISQKTGWGFGTQTTQETIASGFIDTDKNQGSFIDKRHYWFMWQRTFPKGQDVPLVPESFAKPMLRALESVHSFIGPLAPSFGVSRLFQPDIYLNAKGPGFAKLNVVVSGSALAQLFDSSKVHSDLLWRAFASMAQTVIPEEIGLPHKESSFLPQGISRDPVALEACQIISLYWGGFYCTVFEQNFLKPLLSLQQKPLSDQHLDFLDRFHRLGFLAQPLGAKILIRYLSEVLNAVKHDVGQDPRIVSAIDSGFTVSFRYQNKNDPSLPANPEILVGDLSLVKKIDALNLVELHEPLR